MCLRINLEGNGKFLFLLTYQNQMTQGSLTLHFVDDFFRTPVLVSSIISKTLAIIKPKKFGCSASLEIIVDPI
jgi:hypothetical protein